MESIPPFPWTNNAEEDSWELGPDVILARETRRAARALQPMFWLSVVVAWGAGLVLGWHVWQENFVASRDIEGSAVAAFFTPYLWCVILLPFMIALFGWFHFLNRLAVIREQKLQEHWMTIPDAPQPFYFYWVRSCFQGCAQASFWCGFICPLFTAVFSLVIIFGAEALKGNLLNIIRLIPMSALAGLFCFGGGVISALLAERWLVFFAYLFLPLNNEAIEQLPASVKHPALREVAIDENWSEAPSFSFWAIKWWKIAFALIKYTFKIIKFLLIILLLLTSGTMGVLTIYDSPSTSTKLLGLLMCCVSFSATVWVTAVSVRAGTKLSAREQ